MLEWADDLKVRDSELYLDSRQPRALCFVSHAHSDHLGRHGRAIATPATSALASCRIGLRGTSEVPYHTDEMLPDGDTRVRLLPAGHVCGSAMIHVTRPEGTLLYTGDFKLRDCLTVPCAEPVEADHLVMESTYGLPLFRFPPWRSVAEQLVELVELALREGRQPIVMGYALGKAQEATRILTDAGVPVTLHGGVFALNQTCERLGVSLGPYRRYVAEDFHGPRALDLMQRGVLIAPPNVARSPFVTRFKNPLRIMLSGWSMLKGAIYRYGVDHALPLSDHADFDELMELIDRVRPKKIFTHHGYREFAGILQGKGLDATAARPDEQLMLFAD
ncbi:MAG TPA: MBL fold metallo-hydrolase RNA specificity domain-containing protein [Tepidisphaeraceae bacterium]|nr:MBL fold metallo-hydrolase RNA specificity domain-containing protein [Tepidisphaeraceae bacterium]